MITIPRISLDGAHILTPAEMNAIHIATGLHSPAPAAPAGAKKEQRRPI